jgi:hypothetical protein
MSWIRCEERLPANSGRVLVSDGAGVEFGRYLNGGWTDSDYNHEIDTVTHWMPFPALPEDERAAWIEVTE